MSARKEIVRLQRQILRRLKGDVRLHLGNQSPEIERYYREYKKEFSKNITVTSMETLVSRILKSNIVLCGDYHTLRHAQRANIRLLR
ncbi:hypothetical protein ACFLU6_03245, partial [Acidobacteriota bacterium]